MTRDIWNYNDAQTHWEEIMQLAAAGEPQKVSRPDGLVLIIHAHSAPFISGLAAFEGLPREEELKIDRPHDLPKDISF